MTASLEGCSQSGEPPQLTERQTLLLEDLSFALSGPGDAYQGDGTKDAGDGANPDAESRLDHAAVDSFVLHWRSAREQRRKERSWTSGWRWVWQFSSMCQTVNTEFDTILSKLSELQQKREEVVLKTAKLHDQSAVRAAQMDRLQKVQTAISLRLEVFDAAADVSRKIDSADDCLASAPAFSEMLDQLEVSVAYLETHHDFNEAKEHIQHFERLRARACILIRSAFQRGVKGTEAQIEEQLWDKVDDGFVETQVFYTPFRRLVAQHKPFIGLLLERTRLHSLYAATLEEMERAYCGSRSRFIGDAVSEHLCALRGTCAEAQMLPSLLRQGASYLLEVMRREQFLFNDFFDERPPQNQLQAFSKQLGKLFYEMVGPAIVLCSHLDTLRESAAALHGEFIEPNEGFLVKGGVFGTVVSSLVWLHVKLQNQLLEKAREHLAERVCRRNSSNELDSSLFVLSPTIADGSGGPHQDSPLLTRFQSLEQTLVVLSATYGVLPGELFEPLALEATTACIWSLRSASETLERRCLSSFVQDADKFDVAFLVRTLEVSLFLIRNLLVLREQVASLDFDPRIDRRVLADLPQHEFCGHIPTQFWEAAKCSTSSQRVRARRNGAIETALSESCSSLGRGVVGCLVRPVSIHVLSGLESCPSKQSPQQELIARRVRELLPFVVAHVRVYLADVSAQRKRMASKAPHVDHAEGTDAAEQAPAESVVSLVVSFLRESLLTALPSVAQPFDWAREVDSICEEAMKASWPTVRDTVLNAPRGYVLKAGVPEGR